mmetsp:Transcript_10011/g.21116  ORF Transcript_10011/g.21116 Transcript_10011/m.21116 type:complete len:296 (+) Transcript_10011:629-1516(+)
MYSRNRPEVTIGCLPSSSSSWSLSPNSSSSSESSSMGTASTSDFLFAAPPSTPSFWWTKVTCRASAMSRSTSATSSIRNIRSKRLRSELGRLTFSLKDFRRLYLPYKGLAAARTAARALRVATIPALATDTVCCSITSWIAVRSDSSILSNSSMAQIPLSANTNAPPSNANSPVVTSLVIAAVKPTPLDPFPVVYTPRGAMLATCFSNWLLATPGSPMRQMLISPRILIPSGSFRVHPPTSCSNSALLISSCPKISGAIAELKAPTGSSPCAISLMRSSNFACSSALKCELPESS